MKKIAILLLSFIVTLISACGGGGGSAGVSSGGSGAATLVLSLRDSAGVSTNSISFLGGTTARAVLLDGSGSPVVGKVVTFTGDSGLVKFSSPSSGQVLTDSAGVAVVQISPASLSAAGAGTLKASATVGANNLSVTFDFQLSPANLSLQTLDLGTGSLVAYGNRPISVVATVDGVAAGTVPVQVAFSASCGTVAPATVTTDSSGKASTTYKADSITCAGTTVTITASASGAKNVAGTIAIQGVVGSNLLFVSAKPQRIYLTGSVGATQSIVAFQLVDAGGNPLANQAVILSLNNISTGATIGSLGNTSPVIRTTDSTGVVSVPVFSGTVPTSVQVKAVLQSNGNVVTNSNTLTVASGRPAQGRASLALEKLAIEGWSHDGVTTSVTLFLADRQGNPVPDGTEVNFVTEGGVLVPPVCTVSGGTSQCSVTLQSGNPRPSNGRVSILAYVPGEEDFVDLNGNNLYDVGEPFTDIGNAYRDDNEDGSYAPGEFIVPRTGSVSCAGGVNGVANTCDGVWGPVDVRSSAIVIFASSTSVMSSPTFSGGTLQFYISDVNNNSMPFGTTISAAAQLPPCGVTKVFPTSVLNSHDPVAVKVVTTGCVSGSKIDVSTKSPIGTETQHTYTVP